MDAPATLPALLDDVGTRYAGHVWLRREEDMPPEGSGKIDKPRLRAEPERLTSAGGRRESPRTTTV